MKTILTLLLFLTGCANENKSYEAPIFETNKTLKSNLLNESYLFNNPQDIIIHDSLLLIIDIEKDKILHIFNKNNGEFIKACISKGKANNEIIYARSFAEDKGKLIVCDIEGRKVIKYDLSNLDEDIKYESNKIDNSLLYSDFKYVRDSIFLTSNYDDRFILTTLSNKLYTFGNDSKYDKSIFENQNDWCRFMADTPLSVSPDGKKIVNASYLGAIMESYDISNPNAIKQVFQKKFYKPVFVREKEMPYQFNENTIFGFRELKTTNQYIYGLVHIETMPQTMPTIIWKFDYEGNPIAEYKLDCPLKNFIIDEECGKIYGIAMHENGEIKIVTFNVANKS